MVFTIRDLVSFSEMLKKIFEDRLSVGMRCWSDVGFVSSGHFSCYDDKNGHTPSGVGLAE